MVISPRNNDYTDTEYLPSVCFDAVLPKLALVLISGPEAYARNGKLVPSFYEEEWVERWQQKN